MAAKSDVEIKLEGISFDVIPIGVTINYGVNAVPTAIVDVVPRGGKHKVAAATVFEAVDVKKREGDVTIKIKVTTWTSSGRKTKTLEFLGYFDGLSLSNYVGNNRYSLIIKSKAQVLLELAVTTPGLHPAGVDVWRLSTFNTETEEEDGQPQMSAWNSITDKGVFNNSPLKAYTEVMKWVLDKQYSGAWQEYIGSSKEASGKTPMQEVLNDGRYIENAKTGLEFFAGADLRGVESGSALNGKVESPMVFSSLGEIFTQGPNCILENYLTFLSSIGAAVVFSNSKMYVVPAKSMLLYANQAPGPKALQTKPNRANPADYIGYEYNDNGYRDIAFVLLLGADAASGHSYGDERYEQGVLLAYKSPIKNAKASGVLAVKFNPWMNLAAEAASVVDNKDVVAELEVPGEVMLKSAVSCDDALEPQKKAIDTSVDKKNEKPKDWAKIYEDFAEQKWLEARYGDRTGTIIMDFNPYWVPGTGGTLYVRETNTTLSFYVETVQHSISVTPANAGQATTNITFSCGRYESAGLKKYLYWGYEEGLEKSIQEAWLADNSASLG